MIVIGLTGHAGAGKDSVADVLVRDHGFTKMSFAAPVKALVRELDPIVGYSVYICDCGNLNDCPIDAVEIRLADLYDSYGYTDETVKDSPYGDEVRRLWQRFGTDVMRAEDQDYWVDKAAKAILESNEDRIVFTDVRFPNEAAMIDALGGPFTFDGSMYFSDITSSLWQISRVGDEILYPEDAHESESHAGLLDEELQIINSGTLEDLPGAVDHALDFVINDVIPGQGLLWAGATPNE